MSIRASSTLRQDNKSGPHSPSATPARASRTRTAGREIDDELMEATEIILARDGIAAATIRAIASQAGVAPMCIYHRFGGKSGLIDEWSSRGFRELTMEIAVQEELDPVERLRQVGLRYRDFALRRPGVYVAMFGAPPGRPIAADDSSRRQGVLRQFASPSSSV